MSMTYLDGSQPVCPPWCACPDGQPHYGCHGPVRMAGSVGVFAALLPADRTAPVVALAHLSEPEAWPTLWLSHQQAAAAAAMLAVLGHPELAALITEVIAEVSP